MARALSPGLLKALLSVSRLRNCPSKPVLPLLRESPVPKASSPWQCILQRRSLSAGHDGGDRKGGGDNRPLDPSPNEEFRLFGEGGLFEKPASSEDGHREDDFDELEDDAQWSSAQEQRFEYLEDDHKERVWTDASGHVQAQATEEDFVPGSAAEAGGEGWSARTPLEGLKIDGFPAEETTRAGTALYDEWAPASETEPAFIGTWGPDGRLLKGPSISEEPAFGDLIRKKGYTDDDIANLIAGFYEPVGLPHPDDYVFTDVDAERRQKRREMELQKMAEMAKRWVRKVDEQGFAHGVGRRKTSNARVWIREGQGRIVINKMHHDMYFFSMDDRVKYLEPFVVTDTLGMFDTFVLVRGGGTTGQAGAVRHGVSRALMWFEPSWRPVLKKAGMLTRDSRMVERKKPGKAKARRSFQWVKR